MSVRVCASAVCVCVCVWDLPTHTIFVYSERSFKPEYASTQPWNLIRQKQFLINFFFFFSFLFVESRARHSVDSPIQVLL